MDLTTKILKTCQTILAVFLGYFTFRLLVYHFYLITFPYPAMLREGAIMTTTQALVKGMNPYAFVLQPEYTNVYGIIYPLLVWPWDKLFGTTLLVHRIVTAVFIMASCVLFFLVLKKMKVPLLLNMWAVLMLYASWLYPGTSTPCVDPAVTGMFLLLLTIFIPWFCRYSYKSLVISVLCGVLAFYTKQYTMLGTVIMGLYLFLFISKLKGIFYGILSLALASLSAVMVNRLFPAYFDNCFFGHINMEPSWSTMERLYMQINLYSHLHQWMLILMGFFILWHAFKYSVSLRTKPPIKTFGGKLRDLLKEIASSLKNDPRNDNIILILYAGVISALVLYKSLGRHNGATLWYFFQLLSPFLLMGSAWLFSRTVFWPLLCLPVLVYNLHILTLDENYKWFKKDMPGWPEISHVVDQYQNILNSSLIAPLLIEQGKQVTDNGMSEYFGSGGERTSWTKYFFKEDPRVDIQLGLFFKKIRERVENKQFDLIILQPSLLPLGVDEDVKKFYKYEGGLELYAPQDRRSYAVTVWKPL
jgi:hypothetical protein